jgi:hypothetical protein
MSWPTAAVQIALIAGVTIVLVVGLRVLGDELSRRATSRKKRRELIDELRARTTQVTEPGEEPLLPDR